MNTLASVLPGEGRMRPLVPDSTRSSSRSARDSPAGQEMVLNLHCRALVTETLGIVVVEILIACAHSAYIQCQVFPSWLTGGGFIIH